MRQIIFFIFHPVLFLYTEVPAYSDTLGTWEKRHCNQIVTVSRGGLVPPQLFGTCQKCHCKRCVTVNCVTVSGEICNSGITLKVLVNPVKISKHYFCMKS